MPEIEAATLIAVPPPSRSSIPTNDQVEVADGTILVGGEMVAYVVLSRSQYGASWLERQLNSVEEYELTHLALVTDDHTNRLCSLFGAYLSSAVLEVAVSGEEFLVPNVLDVGCGIYNDKPPYVSKLKGDIYYYGIDPLDVNRDSRSYPFFLGDLTELANEPALESTFDLFIFGTSLDHINNLEQTVTEVHKLASPGAVAVFWCGVHDPELVGEHNGSLVFRKLLSRGVLAGYVSFYLYGLFRLPRLLLRAAVTRYRLQHGIALDELHERYFTIESLSDTVEMFGGIIDSVRVPGSNSVFHRVSLGGQNVGQIDNESTVVEG